MNNTNHPIKPAIKWLSRAGYFALLVAALLLVLSPYIDLIGENIKSHTWIGIFCGVLASFVIHFSEVTEKFKKFNDQHTEKLKELDAKFQVLVDIRGQIKFLSLADAIRSATKNNKHIKDVRIYASTTVVIFQIIRDLKIHIDTCKVMIQTFSEDDPNPHSKKLNELCLDMEESWKELKDKGGIRNLDLIRYNRYPSEYVIIFDDYYLIHGRYTPSLSKHGSEYYEPTIFENQELASKRLIDEQIQWFDKTFNFFKNHTTQNKSEKTDNGIF